MYYLYLKTHNVTGLKYLGKTNSDPFKYKGSGIVWSRHLKKHGNDVTTEILKECKDNKEVREWGIYYSDKWNVVESSKYANLCREEGQGGHTYDKKGKSRPNGCKFHRRGRNPILINGKEYISAHYASSVLDIPRATISYRVKSDFWPDYSFA